MKGTNDWVSLVDRCVSTMNNSISFSTGKTPNQIEEDVTSHKQVGELIQRSANRRYKQKGTGAADLEVGDHVRRQLEYDSAHIRKASKEGYWRKEIYVVTAVVKNRKFPNVTDSYRIKELQTNEPVKGLIARWELLKIPKELERIPEQPVRPPPVNEDAPIEEPEWVVETILGRREVRGTTNKPAHTEYKVKYLGWKTPQWEDEALLTNSQDLIDEYNREH